MHTVRKATVALALLALSAGVSHAQWIGGIKAGAGQSGFTGTSEFDWQPGALTASLFFSKPLTGAISFQPEILFTEKRGESVVASTSLTFNANYFVVPLLLRYDVSTRAVRPYVLLGPSVVIQAQCNVRFVTSGLLSEGTCENNAAANGSFNRVDLGIEGGVGLRIPFARSSLVIEGRGSTSVRTEIVPLETSASRSVGWSVLAGFSAPLRGPRRPSGTAPLPGAQAAVGPGEVPQSTVARVPRGAPLLPTLPAESLVEQRSADAPALAPRSEKLISITAVNADVRPLLIGIAREAGIDLIVTNDVRALVSINLRDMPALEAISTIASAANLTIAQPRQRELPAVVFYQLPIDVNKESAETIAARFGVSLELARFIVASRP